MLSLAATEKLLFSGGQGAHGSDIHVSLILFETNVVISDDSLVFCDLLCTQPLHAYTPTCKLTNMCHYRTNL